MKSLKMIPERVQKRIISNLLQSVLFFILILMCVPCVLGEKSESNNNSSVGGSQSGDSSTGEHEGNDNNCNTTDQEHGEEGHGTKGLYVASWNYHEIRDPFIFTIVILLAGISKIGYHHADFLSSRVPESCILIVFGVLFGAIIKFSGISSKLPDFFQPHEFFTFLLPPIILEASYSLHNRTFGENLGSVLLFAVVGTIFACAFIGVSLFGLAKAGAMGSIADMKFVEIMVFASLIVAVDPVAVLAVFNEVGVNHVLYFLVFGESLLNDGVTVVLYKVFQAYNVMDEITAAHIILGIVKFFVVCLGGLALGILAGLASALLTRTTQHVKVAQPMIIYGVAYLGFLLAELFEFSGIISIVGCGLTQKEFAFQNISDKSSTTIKYFTKVISTMCEIVIFMFLGLSVVNGMRDFHVGFTIWTIVLCLVFRFIIVFSMTFFINWLDSTRVRKINIPEQFMIAYGGLRGAVCFSLVALLNPAEFPLKDMFVTTTLVVVIFTVFVQGISIKPLVYLLQIKLAPEKNSSMYVELNSAVIDHMMAGLEDIIGDHGKNHMREKLDHLNQEYLQPIFTSEPDPAATQLKQFYEHLALKEHLKYLKMSGVREMQNLPDLPHVTTEIFLSGLGIHKEAPIAGGDGSPDETPSVPLVTVVPPNSSFEPDVQVRRRGPTRRSMSYSPGASPGANSVIDQKGLRNLLLSQRNSRLAMNNLDRNLTKHDDFGAEMRKKSHHNQRLQRIFSTTVDPYDTTKKRLSWSESQAEVCKTREGSGRSKLPPRHCVTLDYTSEFPSSRGALPNEDPIFDPVPLLPLSEAVGPLTSVEEENEEMETELTPMIRDSDSSSSDDGEQKDPAMKRRRSSKHKLMRQGGMDQPSSPSIQKSDEDRRDGGGDVM